MAKPKKQTKKSTASLALLLVAAAALIATVLYFNNSFDIRGSAYGRPSTLTLPEQAQGRADTALARMEQITRGIERANQNRARTQGTEVSQLAQQLRTQQATVESLVSAAKATGLDTTDIMLRYEKVLMRAEEGLQRAMETAPVQSRQRISEALERVREGLQRAEEHLGM